MRILIGFLAAALSFSVFAETPKVAVTDLAYEKQIKDYIKVTKSDTNKNVNSSGSGNTKDYSHDSSSSFHQTEGTNTYVTQSELRNFMGDIKGELKKTNLVSLIQGRPYSGSTEFDNIYDIISRIDQGDFDGADYVLFGTLSDMQFVDNVTNIQHTNTYSKNLGLTVVADFSLINTQTHEIVAAFTASGEAKEVKLINSRDQKVTLNRANLVRKVSKALGKDVANQVVEQLTGQLPDEEYTPPVRNNVPKDEPPVVIKRK